MKAIYLEITFAIRSCSLDIKPCTETFSLYKLEKDNASPKPAFDKFTEKVATLGAAPGELTNDTPAHTLNTSKAVIPVQVKRKGVYFAIQESSSCFAIFSFEVYYKWCPDYDGKLVIFPKTAAPASESRTVQVEGICDQNAVSVPGSGGAHAYCNTTGEWVLDSNSVCVCEAGYQLTAAGDSCEGWYRERLLDWSCEIVLCGYYCYYYYYHYYYYFYLIWLLLLLLPPLLLLLLYHHYYYYYYTIVFISPWNILSISACCC